MASERPPSALPVSLSTPRSRTLIIFLLEYFAPPFFAHAVMRLSMLEASLTSYIASNCSSGAKVPSGSPLLPWSMVISPSFLPIKIPPTIIANASTTHTTVIVIFKLRLPLSIKNCLNVLFSFLSIKQLSFNSMAYILSLSALKIYTNLII